MQDADIIERRSGVAMWRQIADAIRAGLSGPLVDDQGQLPTEKTLAERFGVNRHTVRAAIRALTEEGVLRAEQGRGTFVQRRQRLTYPIGQRTRFSAGLEGQASERIAAVLSSVTEPAYAACANDLDLPEGAPVIRLESLGLADGVPVSRATSFFDAARFAGIDAAIRRQTSITRALAEFGVEDYVRLWTRIEARHGAPDDLADLRLSPGAIVLVTQSLNVDTDDRPVHRATSRFAADSVSLVVGQHPT